MKFELNFDKKIFLEQQEKFIDLAWENNKRDPNKSIPIIIFILVVSIFLIYNNKYFGYLGLGYSISQLIVLISYRLNLQKSKKNFLSSVNDEADRYLSKGNEMILEFNDNSFYYRGLDYETTIGWDTFKGFRVIDNSIFMDLNVGNTVSYIINESQIGEENFRKLIGFLGSKIKRN